MPTPRATSPSPVAEIELKFQIPPGRRAAVLAWLREQTEGTAPRLRLQAAYVDTPDHALAAAGLALRLRREGRQWVQTLKGLGDDGLSRIEHELPLRRTEVDPADPQADPARHAGHPLGERLLGLLARAAGPAAPVYRTDILRLVRGLRSRHGRVELALDEGRIEGGGRAWRVRELEIELLSGQPRAVLDVARRWALPLGLWLDTRSKAQRGHLLALGQAMAPPVALATLRLAATASAQEVLRRTAANARPAVLENASQIAEGCFAPGHLASLRQALRRLVRVPTRCQSDPVVARQAMTLADAAADLLGRLHGLDAAAPQAAAAAIRALPSQQLLLDLLAAGLPPPDVR